MVHMCLDTHLHRDTKYKYECIYVSKHIYMHIWLLESLQWKWEFVQHNDHVSQPSGLCSPACSSITYDADAHRPRASLPRAISWIKNSSLCVLIMHDWNVIYQWMLSLLTKNNPSQRWHSESVALKLNTGYEKSQLRPIIKWKYSPAKNCSLWYHCCFCSSIAL